MKGEIKSEHVLGDMIAIYYEVNNITSLMLVPASKRNEVLEDKFDLPDGLVQIFAKDDYRPCPYCAGLTMRNSQSTLDMRFISQKVNKINNTISIITILKSFDCKTVEHKLIYKSKTPYITCNTTLINDSLEPIDIQMLSSFSINGITPFIYGEAQESMWLHRFRSYWSGEGRHEETRLESLNMETSWSRWATKSERFGQVGTMPVRGFFPWCGIEDRVSGVIWAVSLAWAGSWQIEPYRQDYNVAISGGLADFETGHWEKHLEPGEKIITPDAYITVAEGNIDTACDRLLETMAPDYNTLPETEKELPVIFNEYLETWGHPTEKSVLSQINVQKELGTKYFVIDAGWFGKDNWSSNIGDWDICKEVFPNGLKFICEKIREAGMIPGIWFELEAANKNSLAFKNYKKDFLTYNNKIVYSSQRVFWDLRKQESRDYLYKKVILMLKENGFGYIKVDYNESIGIGVDGAESIGEGLRQCVLEVQNFFKFLKSEIPDLIIENCASGGHRLEPSLMNLSSMASFSDAHECNEIPIIAASVSRLIPAAKSQIWACIKETDSIHRVIYSLSNGFLGRLCLSGPVKAFSGEKKNIVKHAVELYARCAPTIRDGITRINNNIISWTKPTGWQSSVRVNKDLNQAIVVFNLFNNKLNDREIVIKDKRIGSFKICDVLSEKESNIYLDNNEIHITTTGDFQGVVIYLKK